MGTELSPDVLRAKLDEAYRVAELRRVRAEKAEARLAAVPALVEALWEIDRVASLSKIGGPRMDGLQQYTSPRFGQIRELAREALAAYEQDQEQR